MKKIKKQTGFLILCALILGFSACDDSVSSSDLSAGVDAGGFIPARLEVPALKGTADDQYVEHRVTIDGVDQVNYCMEFNKAKRHSRWVAYTLHSGNCMARVSRVDAFTADPSIAESDQASRSDFNGYDRGHICPSADRLGSAEANLQTFYYSNMSPQKSSFNQTGGAWYEHEGIVRSLGRNALKRDTLYIVKGGVIENKELLSPVTYSQRCVIPRFYFMALLVLKNNRYKAMAYWLDQKLNTSKEITIDALEDSTGIDFFPALPDAIERQVESIKYNF